MDNCDLEKLSISVGKLYPPFEPNLLNYKVIVLCNTSSVTLELLTSDCGASYKIVSINPTCIHRSVDRKRV